MSGSDITPFHANLIRISEILPLDRESYLTHVILPDGCTLVVLELTCMVVTGFQVKVFISHKSYSPLPSSHFFDGLHPRVAIFGWIKYISGT